MNSKFLRYCKLTFSVYNQDESKDKEIYYINGGGLPGMAHIVFDIERDKDGTNTIAEIKVFNLRDETAKLIKSASNITLEVGYASDDISEIFTGTVAQAITKKFIDSESIFYCVTGKLELGKKIAIALGTGSMLKSILWEIDKKLCEIYGKTVVPGEFLILQNTNVFGDYLNKIYTKGYVMVDSIKNILNQIRRSYPDIEWVFDGNKVYFFNPKDNTKSGRDFTIQSGVNLIAADYSSRERDFREKFFKERIPNKKEKPSNRFSKKTEIETITVSCLMDKDLNIIKNVRLINSENQESVHVIKSMRYIGDTHSNGDNWKIDLELYDHN